MIVSSPPHSQQTVLIGFVNVRDFTSEDGGVLIVEAKLGGRMFEDWGDGDGQLWGVVHGLEQGRYLQIIGDTHKAWGGPSRGIMNWRFEDSGEGTKVRLEHCLYGNVTDKTRASLEEGWSSLLRDASKVFVETGRGPGVDTQATECGTS